jgi:hypothetical protein
LYLAPFADQTKVLHEFSSGHLANPMNQAYISQLPLFSLGQYYQGSKDTELLQKACEALCPSSLATYIVEDAVTFQQHGLANLSENERYILIEKYMPHEKHPMAKEIIDWLNGVYTFDPNCLT